ADGRQPEHLRARQHVDHLGPRGRLRARTTELLVQLGGRFDVGHLDALLYGFRGTTRTGRTARRGGTHRRRPKHLVRQDARCHTPNSKPSSPQSSTMRRSAGDGSLTRNVEPASAAASRARTNAIRPDESMNVSPRASTATDRGRVPSTSMTVPQNRPAPVMSNSPTRMMAASVPSYFTSTYRTSPREGSA